MPVKFEWDERKAASNFKKHGVTSEEARTVFEDPVAAIFADEEHSVEETREIIVGHSAKSRLLLVSFTERDANLVRIISARKATKRERKDYEEATKK
jgi:uncharacterized DUF497 family protein